MLVNFLEHAGADLGVQLLRCQIRDRITSYNVCYTKLLRTLGDPLADLAYALNFWPDPSDDEPVLPEAATAPEGFPTRTELAERYAERTGRDLSSYNFV